MTDNTNIEALPVMPAPAHPTHSIGPLWSADQMREYGLLCHRAALSNAEPDNEPIEYELYQDDCLVASVSALPAMALVEMARYAIQYREDGPIQLFKVTRKRIELGEITNTGEQG